MSPFSPDTPFNYAPLVVQDSAATFSLLPLPLVYFAFCLPLVAALIMARMAWAGFYATLVLVLAFASFPNNLTVLGAALLLSLPVFVAMHWGKDDVRFHKTLPLTTCVVVYLMVPLGFPRTVPLQVSTCVETRGEINEAAQKYLQEQPAAVLEVKALVPKHLSEEPGCQGPRTSEYILNATDTEILVTCANPAHQREDLGPARTSYPRQSTQAPEEPVTEPQPAHPADSDQKEG